MNRIDWETFREFGITLGSDSHPKQDREEEPLVRTELPDEDRDAYPMHERFTPCR